MSRNVEFNLEERTLKLIEFWMETTQSILKFLKKQWNFFPRNFALDENEAVI
jgi:hypothetical protein